MLGILSRLISSPKVVILSAIQARPLWILCFQQCCPSPAAFVDSLSWRSLLRASCFNVETLRTHWERGLVHLAVVTSRRTKSQMEAGFCHALLSLLFKTAIHSTPKGGSGALFGPSPMRLEGHIPEWMSPAVIVVAIALFWQDVPPYR